jgi:hypothetical protein
MTEVIYFICDKTSNTHKRRSKHQNSEPIKDAHKTSYVVTHKQ